MNLIAKGYNNKEEADICNGRGLDPRKDYGRSRPAENYQRSRPPVGNADERTGAVEDYVRSQNRYNFTNDMMQKMFK
jgi:hypothetical protein